MITPKTSWSEATSKFNTLVMVAEGGALVMTLVMGGAIAPAGKMAEMKRKAGDEMDDDWALFITMCINRSFSSDLCPSN